MDTLPQTLTIGALSKAAGVSVETVRFYQRKGLLQKPVKHYGGIARYSVEYLTRLNFVKSVQNLDFSLDEVASLLKLEDGICCEEVQILTKQKIKNIRKKLLHLRSIESRLTQILKDCCSKESNKDCLLTKHSE